MSNQTGTALFEFSSAAMKVQNQNEVWDCLKQSLAKFGMQSVNYAYGKQEDFLLLSNMSPDWLSYYSENFSMTDHLINHCVGKSETLYMDLSYFTGGTDLDELNQEMLGLLWDLGSRSGISVPLPTESSDLIGATGIFFGMSERDSAEVMERHGEEIALIMLVAHQFIRRQELQIGDDVYTTNHGQKMKRQEILTDREKDILRYLVIGLRPDRIAEKLQLKVSTINMHIAKARRRLGAATREQAIAMAISKRQLII